MLEVDPLERLRLRRSAKWRARPNDVLPLPVAEMDFALAPNIQAELRDAVERSDTGYAYPGTELGEAVASFAKDRWGWTLDPAQVSCLPDVGVCAVEMLRAVCEPGDPVVINPPIYPPFFQWVAETHTRLVEVPLRRDASGDYRLDLDALKDAFAAGARVFVLCNPHNPVGRVHEPGELAEVVALADRYGVRIISDEIHGALVLPGATFTPFLTVPGAADVGVSLVSGSKAFNLAGLKCAAIVADSPQLWAEVRRIPPDARWRSGHFGVLATIAAFTSSGAWLDELLETLDHNRSQLGELLAAQLPAVSWVPPQATYLAWLDCRSLGLDQPASVFLERGRVAVEEGAHFGAPGRGFVRLNFGTSVEIIAEAVERMARALG